MHHLIGYLTSHLPGRALAPRDRGDAGHTDPVVIVCLMTATGLLLMGIAVSYVPWP
jgi:hypothetical protein